LDGLDRQAGRQASKSVLSLFLSFIYADMHVCCVCVCVCVCVYFLY
jgi:hypothetical protein